MCSNVCVKCVLVLVLLVTVAPVVPAQEDPEPDVVEPVAPTVSHLCHFNRTLLEPTDLDGDQYCDCKDPKTSVSGLPEVRIDCHKRGMGDDFWQGAEQLPQGTTRLDLSRNKLTSVPHLVGESLSYLSLSDNRIATLPDRAFANVSNLRELDLRGNLLDVITTDALAGLVKLHKIDLSDNLIQRIQVNAFSGALELKHLILSNNSLGEFLNRTESDLYLRCGVTNRLETLELHRCNITDVNLASGVGLQKLLLGHNRIQRLTRLPKQLSHLDLSGTPIRTLPAKFLPHLLHLEMLVLQDMPILYTLDEYSLYGLNTLNLQGSRNLSTIHPHAFGQNVARNDSDLVLQRLILKGTNIRTLNATLRFAFENLRLLDVRGAPLRCDCGLRWVRELPQLVTVGICVRPSALREKKFGMVEPSQFQCRAEQFWIYTVFNILLAILLIVLVSVGIFLIVRAIRPKPTVQLRMVGANSPYARVTIEPNRAEVL